MNNLNNFNFQDENEYDNFNNSNNNNNNRGKKESKALNALVYFIVIITVAMIAPLVYQFADSYSNSRPLTQNDSEVVNVRNTKNKKYSVIEKTIDISGLKNTDYGNLDLITAKVMDSGDIILFCSALAVKNTGDSDTENLKIEYIEYEDVLRIASIKNRITAIKNIKNKDENDENNINSRAVTEIEISGDIEIYSRALPVRYNLLESLRNEDYIFKDFTDGTFFMSNNKAAFVFDVNAMKISVNYTYPANYSVYQSSLSNNKEMLALATEEGFFVGNLKDSNMTLNSSNMKELIAPVNINGIKLSARYPVWSNDDEHIYYKLYADNFVRNAGVTTSSPGGNEQLTALDCNNFLFLNNDSVFYYFLSGTEATPGNQFRCGYFNVSEKKMTDVMKSQVYYFDIDVSSRGTHLAALSYNGNMIKISIIDIRTKKLIYSSLYGEIYDFSFSPDEKNVIIYGSNENEKSLKVININWTEE